MRSATIAAIVLAVWFLGVLAAGAAGAFHSAPSDPPLAVLVAVAGPPLLFALAYRASRPFRDFVLGIDLRLLTAIQSWRVIGGTFLVLYAFDLLPGLFAWPAGAGDLAVGLAAPFVVLAMLREGPTWRRQGVAQHRRARRGASLGLLPLSLVPTFAVPLWIVFHAISLLQLHRLRAWAPGCAAMPSGAASR